jgi:hypothetical protein
VPFDMSASERTPSCDLCVIYNDDAMLWPDYIKRQMATSVRFRSLLDVDMPTASCPVSDAKVVLVIMSFGHVEFLQSATDSAAYCYRDVEADQGLLFLCGVEEDNLKDVPTAEGGRTMCRDATGHFPHFSRWTRVKHDADAAVLRKTIERLLAAWSPPKVKLYPTVARSEVRGHLVLSYTYAVHEMPLGVVCGENRTTAVTFLNEYQTTVSTVQGLR